MKRQVFRLLFSTILLFSSSYMLTNAQNITETADDFFLVVDNLPEFIGGADALQKYFYDNLQYPIEAEILEIEGRVIIQVVIDEHGNVTKPHVIRGIHPVLDEEALRVVADMPKWKPGMHQGKRVKVKYNFPVVFENKYLPISNPVSDKLNHKEYSDDVRAKHIALSKGLVGVWRQTGIIISDHVVELRTGNYKIINNDGTLYTIVVGGMLPNGIEVPTRIGFFGTYYDVTEDSYFEKTIENFMNPLFNNVVSELKYEIVNDTILNSQYRRAGTSDNWMHEIWMRVNAK